MGIFQKKLFSFKIHFQENYTFVMYDTDIKDAGERGGSVVECRTPEREVGGSRPTAAVLCP